MNGAAPVVSFTVDVESDCPPYLTTERGLTEGMPRLLDWLAQHQVRATFFTTGDAARRYPTMVRRVVDEGHELGCHGDTHRDFTTLTPNAAARELRESLAVLRSFASVTSFRAPYLRFPMRYLAMLADAGIRLDSSQARYKTGPDHRPGPVPAGLVRVPVAVTSSVLRLPAWLRNPWLGRLRTPVVLFVHPWELVDWRHTRLRLDCRFRTGEPALLALAGVIGFWRTLGARFALMRELEGAAKARANDDSRRE